MYEAVGAVGIIVSCQNKDLQKKLKIDNYIVVNKTPGDDKQILFLIISIEICISCIITTVRVMEKLGK